MADRVTWLDKVSQSELFFEVDDIGMGTPLHSAQLPLMMMMMMASLQKLH